MPCVPSSILSPHKKKEFLLRRFRWQGESIQRWPHTAAVRSKPMIRNPRTGEQVRVARTIEKESLSRLDSVNTKSTLTRPALPAPANSAAMQVRVFRPLSLGDLSFRLDRACLTPAQNRKGPFVELTRIVNSQSAVALSYTQTLHRRTGRHIIARFLLSPCSPVSPVVQAFCRQLTRPEFAALPSRPPSQHLPPKPRREKQDRSPKQHTRA